MDSIITQMLMSGMLMGQCGVRKIALVQPIMPGVRQQNSAYMLFTNTSPLCNSVPLRLCV